MAATVSDDKAKRAKLAAVFADLAFDMPVPVRKRVARVRRLIDMLVPVRTAATVTPASAQNFRNVGKERSADTLREMLELYRKVEALHARLSASEISRLADAGWDRPAAHYAARNTVAAVPRALALPLKGKPDGGRPKNWRAFVVAYEVLRTLVELTGYDPARLVARQGRGGYVPLLRAVFDVMGIEASAEAAGKNAERTWNDRDKTIPAEGGLNPLSDSAISIV